MRIRQLPEVCEPLARRIDTETRGIDGSGNCANARSTPSRSRSFRGVDSAVPRRPSALPPARRTPVHAESTTSAQTTRSSATPEPSEPRDATIVTSLASPPKRHRTIRHALRWHETAQGTTPPLNADTRTKRPATGPGVPCVARARDGRSVDRAPSAEAPLDVTVPTPLGDRRSTRRAARRIPSRRRARTRVALEPRGERPRCAVSLLSPPRRAARGGAAARSPPKPRARLVSAFGSGPARGPNTAGASARVARLETVGWRRKRVFFERRRGVCSGFFSFARRLLTETLPLRA